jgi:endonuclease/exonuclease/phosphatase family metal-dependent hydrolase
MRFALTATVQTPAGSLRVCDTHLDTRLNARERLAQIAPVVEESARAAGPVLIGGDFNSNPFYWVGHVVPLPAWRHQSESVWHYMTERGFHSTLAPAVATFDHLGMHLDWIWARNMRVGPSEVHPLRFSDHHAVRTRITF